MPGNNEGCGRLSIDCDHTDAEVTEQLLTALASHKLAPAVGNGQGGDEERELVAALGELERRLEELSSDYYGSGLLSRAGFLAGREQLQQRLDVARRRLDALAAGNVTRDVLRNPQGIVEAWDGLDGQRRRAIIKAVVERIDVAPLSPDRPRRFDPDRVSIVWRA